MIYNDNDELENLKKITFFKCKSMQDGKPVDIIYEEQQFPPDCNTTELALNFYLNAEEKGLCQIIYFAEKDYPVLCKNKTALELGRLGLHICDSNHDKRTINNIYAYLNNLEDQYSYNYS